MRKKLKTHRGVAKRFSITSSGKLMRKRSGKRHLLSHKSSKRMRRMDTPVALKQANHLSIKLLLPYGN